jgi:hypothetical protein
VSHLCLHLEAKRKEILGALSERPIPYDAVLRSWIVTNPFDAVELLRNSSFRVAEIQPALELIQRKYSIELPNVTFAASVLPLLLEGDAHATMRRKIAGFLTARRTIISKNVSSLVEACFHKLHESSDVEIVEEILTPLVVTLSAEIVGTGQPLPFTRLLLVQLFDRFVSISKLKQIEAELGKIRNIIQASVCPEDEGLVLTLLIMGRDPLLASLAEALRHVFQRNLGQRLDSVTYPDFPPETGVPVAERIAQTDLAHNGTCLSGGDRIRVYLQSLSYSGAKAHPGLIFGVGAHSCLGRSMSLELWSAITRKLATIPRAIDVVESSYVESNIMVMPQNLRIRLSP